MIYIKINEIIYPAVINGKMVDREWDDRETKAITLCEDFETVNTLFSDGVAWSIITEDVVTTVDENGKETSETQHEEYDNSEFCIRGDLIIHIDGTCTVKMGKPTDLENAYEILYGGM
jgi:hypothetical protein